MIVDFKLPGSGEFDIRFDARLENLQKLDQASIWHAVKFVCKDENDFAVAMQLYYDMPEKFKNSFIWYYGKVWNTPHISDARLVALAMVNKLPWRLNVQLHNHIWDPQERGR